MAGTQAAVIHESPYRVLELMEAVAETLPDAFVSASCDLTKLHELTLRGTPEEIVTALKENEKSDKGEYCIVLDLRKVQKIEEAPKTDASLEARLFEKLLDGAPMRDAMRALTDAGEKKNAVYAASLRVKTFLEEPGT